MSGELPGRDTLLSSKCNLFKLILSVDRSNHHQLKHLLERVRYTTPFPLKDYRLAFSLCPLRSLRLCLDLLSCRFFIRGEPPNKTPLNRRGTRRTQIAAVKKKISNSNRVEVLSIFFWREENGCRVGNVHEPNLYRATILAHFCDRVCRKLDRNHFNYFALAEPLSRESIGLAACGLKSNLSVYETRSSFL
jgi:hypothetical protein